MREPLPIIGWREWVALPDLGVARLMVKVDTGARTSALHAKEIERLERRGRALVRFRLPPERRSPGPELQVTATLIDERRIKSSNGQVELRPVIEAEIELFGQRWPLELTLTSRDLMGFRMLLGRQAIRRRFTVDPGRSFLAEKAAVGGRARGSR